ncbi:MAG: hypothetical protein FJY73_09350 [Candidatus Eisenbacteria bacterium]|nr:hypothetical protein [Candidatus Eisenbacteria bacterium]
MKHQRMNLRGGLWVFVAILTGTAPALAGFGIAASWGVGAGVPLTIERVSYRYDEPFDPWFVDPLDGRGEWVHVRSVGGPVWFPYVEVEWRPYLHGHWVLATVGMMWVAYEPWGWLTHHYGRWVWLDGYGWGWVPGGEYGPAWVSWVVVDGYVGWAPLPPDGFFYPRRTTYHYTGPGTVFGRPVRQSIVDIDINLFVFVSNRHFHDCDIRTHALPARRSAEFFRRKEVVPIGRSLEIDEVRAITRTRVAPVRVEARTYRSGDRRAIDYEPVGQAERIRKARESYERVDARKASSERLEGETRFMVERRARAERSESRAPKSSEISKKKEPRERPRSESSTIRETKKRVEEKARSVDREDKYTKSRAKSESERKGKASDARKAGEGAKKKR